jgi:hypothetical protein
MLWVTTCVCVCECVCSAVTVVVVGPLGSKPTHQKVKKEKMRNSKLLQLITASKVPAAFIRVFQLILFFSHPFFLRVEAPWSFLAHTHTKKKMVDHTTPLVSSGLNE